MRILFALLLIPAAVGLEPLPARAAGFTAGNLVVLRVGSGASALSSAAAPVFLDEYTPAGGLVQSVPLPAATAGSQRRLTMSGSATTEGALSLSADEHYVTLAGYDADPGTASVAGTSSATVARVVARVGGDGGADTTTAITDTFSGNNIRGAVSDDGSRFWAIGANGGVRLAALGSAGTSTQINSAAPTNIRTVGIAGGQLYISTGSGTTGVYSVGAGLPSTGGQTPALTTAVPSPYAFAVLDRSPAVPGVDTLYVADDSGTPNGGILKFSFDGSTWTARGSLRPNGSGARGLTAAVTGSSATLFATTSATAAQLVRIEDTAAFDATISATATTLATASANTALRGVAFAPTSTTTAPIITGQPQDTTVPLGGTATLSVNASGTGPLTYQWYAGTAGDIGNPIPGATSASYTTPPLAATISFWVRVSGPGGTADSRTATVTVTSTPNTAPTITPSPVQPLALTVGDPDNPPALRTVEVDDAQTPVSGLTVTVTTSNAAVATGGATGTGGTRTLTVNPVGVGQATLTVTVSDGDLQASSTFPVAVSGALPAGTHNHYGASDASTAIDLGDGTMLVADDETNVLRVYDRAHSRYPSQEIDLRAGGLALRDTDPTREIDIEASARTGSVIFWVGSHGQNSSGNTRLNRQELFTTNTSGAIGGSYQHLRDDLIAWDQANGDALGLAAAATRAPEETPSGFNIEGAEFLADGTTLLLGFRGPLTGDGKAIAIPVTNAAALVTANPTTGVAAAFGTALLWDLGGRGIREIRQIGGEYVIIAGPTSASGDFKFYTWDGNPASQPLPRAGSLDSVAAVGKPEVILPNATAGTVQVLTDSGDTVFYGDGTIAKDLPTVLRKSTSATVTIGAPPACTGTVVSIGSVQGVTDVSPRVGQTVSIRGTVVGDYEGATPALRGFFVQDSGDGNPSTSDGVFVFDASANLVSLGDVVQVTGPVSEFQGQTQLTASAGGVDSCGSQAAVTPTDVTLPVAAADTLERYEGMLVRFHQNLTVTEHFQLGRFGQVVVSSGGRLRQPTADIRATDTAAVAAAQQANNLNRLIIDDALQNQNPDPIIFGRAGQPLSASNTLRGGDTVTDPIGVLTYTFGGNAASPNAYRLRPIGALGGAAVFDEANPRPDTPPAVGSGAIKVASANLLNFFNTFTNCHLGTLGGVTDCRGANDTTEYQRQLAKEVASLRFLGADVIGYMEMENDGYGPSSAVQALANALNAADGPGAWAFIDADAGTGVVDVAGTDAIKAGLLYRPASVHPVPGKTFVDQNPLFERRPVAQTFENNAGARFTVIANHFKSKGSCPASGPDTDQGDGQSCWNPHRTEQANELAQWVQATVVPAAGDPDVFIVGDLNSYAGEDPIAALEGHGYTNLVKAFHGNDAYSYVFDGQWGYLDYVLVSASLTPQVTGAADAHHNADEPSVLDYNTDFKSAGQIASLYAPDRFRTSDHDPVLAALDLGLPATISGTPPGGVVGEPYSFAFTLGGTGSATVTFDSGSLPPGLTLGVDGSLSGSPTAAGDFAFTVRAGNPYGSATHSVSVHVGKGGTATTLTVTPNPVVTGNPVTLTAAVSAPVATTGPVTFLDGTTILGTGPATLTVTLPSGPHSITARFEGDANLQPSTSEATVLAVIDPVVLDGSLPDGTVGTPYSATVPFTGGRPVTFTLTGGSLPPGLAMSSDGAITGTPTTGGGFAFTITAANAASTASQAYAVTIARAATTTTVVSSANPSTVEGEVRFTATVTGPFTPTGQVQFTVDGQPLGGPVALSGGVAVSSPHSTLKPGAHQVTASYLGGTSYLPSQGSMTQAVRYGIRAVSPTSGAQIRAGSLVPIAFQLVDIDGNPIPLGESLLLTLSGRLSVAASGAQSLPPTRVLFDPFSRTFVLPWFTVPRLLGGHTGQVTITISVAYRDLPTQQLTIPITLT
ncbi:ExeM/NucH family extracellular endonuclease [Rhizocola hellebori]|uniref:ExeM/NucH family extracellular endonuclease n=1 Tax=Rhizocola hellebori TaxID=1392758 RepID=UPI001EF17CC5|nr:ExeM/NucH family extracellular endonuclease [Rhizocola hellebori]